MPPNDIVQVKKGTIAGIVFAIIVLGILAYLYWIYRPDNITILYILVGFLLGRSIMAQVSEIRLRKRLKRLEDTFLGR